jgi:protein phosphatase
MREARAGDRYLLCSDGLSGVVSEETLAEALKDPDPQSTADRLIELALRSGGPDNVTVIVADVVEDEGRPSLMEPVVDGAAGDNVGQRQVDRRSAAGRAALADPPAPAPPPPTASSGGGPSARRRPLRLILVAVAVLVLLVAGGIGTYAWALGHWFVGVHTSGNTEEVAVFRGLDASIVGLDLYRLDETTDLALADLTPAARNRVRSGITAADSSDVDRILEALRDQRLPPCPAEKEDEEAAGGSGASASASRSPGRTTGSTPADATGTRTTAPTRSTSPAGSGSAGGSVSRTSEARTTTPLEPGEGCREEK